MLLIPQLHRPVTFIRLLRWQQFIELKFGYSSLMRYRHLALERVHDSLVKERYFDITKLPTVHDAIKGVEGPGEGKSKESFWRKLKKLLFLKEER